MEEKETVEGGGDLPASDAVSEDISTNSEGIPEPTVGLDDDAIRDDEEEPQVAKVDHERSDTPDSSATSKEKTWASDTKSATETIRAKPSPAKIMRPTKSMQAAKARLSATSAQKIQEGSEHSVRKARSEEDEMAR